MKGMSKTRKYPYPGQIHVSLHEEDFLAVVTLADDEERTIAATTRLLIREALRARELREPAIAVSKLLAEKTQVWTRGSLPGTIGDAGDGDETQ